MVAGRTHPMLPSEKTIGVVTDGATLMNLPPLYLDLDGQIQLMDKAGIDKAVIQIGIPQEWNAKGLAPAVNDGIAAAVDRYPDRLIGLAHVPQLDDEGTEELHRARKDLGLSGLAVVTNIDGVYPDSDRWSSLLHEADRLRLPVVVHPTSLPHHMKSTGDDTKQYNWARIVGRAYDLTIFTMKLLTSGILDRYPRLDFLIAHTGGTFFALAETYLARAGTGPVTKWKGRVFFDTAVRTGKLEISNAMKVLGPDFLAFGTDFPYSKMEERLELLDGLRGAGRAQVLHRNAQRLFFGRS